MKFVSLRWMWVMAVALTSSNAQAVLYQSDDGGFEGDVQAVAGSRSLILLHYNTPPGGDVINSLTYAKGNDSGGPVDMLLYADPNGDGNPDDASALMGAG